MSLPLTLKKLRDPVRVRNTSNYAPPVEPPGRGNEGAWTKATRQIAAEAQAAGDKVRLAKLFAAMDKRAKKLKGARENAASQP